MPRKPIAVDLKDVVNRQDICVPTGCPGVCRHRAEVWRRIPVERQEGKDPHLAVDSQELLHSLDVTFGTEMIGVSEKQVRDQGEVEGTVLAG